MYLFTMLFTGCQHGLTLPPNDDGGYAGPLKPSMRLKVRPRENILPGWLDSSPPQPEPAVYASQCEDLDDGGLVNGPDCATARIQCGDTIVGHTVGGGKNYDTRFYEKNFCTPATTNHDGGDERVYQLVMPDGDHKAFVTLDSPCADLDLAAIKANTRECPSRRGRITQCEMWPRDGNSREVVELVSQRPTTWWIVVEGKNNEEGAFALHVQCKEGLY